MNITNDCVHCIVGQIDKAIDHLQLDAKEALEIQKEVEKRSKSFSFEHTPPYVARDVYEYLAQKTNCTDPLESIKQASIENALTFVPFIEKKYDKRMTNSLLLLKPLLQAMSLTLEPKSNSV